MCEVDNVFILRFKAEHDFDRAIAEDHAAVSMERVVAAPFKNVVSLRHNVLVVEELLKELVEGHLEDLGGNFHLVDDEALALVAETEHGDGVVIVLR